MRPGKLRFIITIEEPSLGAVGDYGDPVISWSTFATVWADFFPLRGKELFAAKASQSETTGRFVMRYISGVTSKMRISYNGKIYNITECLNINGRDKELHVLTQTGVNEG